MSTSAHFHNPNMFANNPLDRAAERRDDPVWLAERLADPSTLIAPLWQLKPFLIAPREPKKPLDVGWLRPGLLGDLVEPDATTIFLGVEKGEARFAIEISPKADPENAGPLAGLGEFDELRNAAPRLRASEAAILAQAKSMIDWHARHRFCSNCGAPTVSAQGGYRRDCDACEAQHFPRTDPVVIMLPVYGQNCLLGRAPKWPERMFSCLAGFMEPGESIEEAVAREVYEETRVRVRNVAYRYTQPWPYPSSLMIGCTCEAENTDIEIDGTEISEARWFSRSEVLAALGRHEDSPYWVPPPLAIAHQLLKTWIAE